MPNWRCSASNAQTGSSGATAVLAPFTALFWHSDRAVVQERIDALLEWMDKIQGLENPRKWALCLLREVSSDSALWTIAPRKYAKRPTVCRCVPRPARRSVMHAWRLPLRLGAAIERQFEPPQERSAASLLMAADRACPGPDQNTDTQQQDVDLDTLRELDTDEQVL